MFRNIVLSVLTIVLVTSSASARPSRAFLLERKYTAVLVQMVRDTDSAREKAEEATRHQNIKGLIGPMSTITLTGSDLREIALKLLAEAERLKAVNGGPKRTARMDRLAEYVRKITVNSEIVRNQVFGMSNPEPFTPYDYSSNYSDDYSDDWQVPPTQVREPSSQTDLSSYGFMVEFLKEGDLIRTTKFALGALENWATRVVGERSLIFTVVYKAHWWAMYNL